MNNFDVSAYLEKQFQRSSEKMKAVEDAAIQKKNLLSQTTPKEPSWVDSLGIDPDGLLASGVNAIGSLATGASRMVGNIAALPDAAGYSADMADMPAEAVNSFNREKQGIATPEESALLDYRPASGRSFRERLESAQENTKQANAINKTFDISHVVDPSKQKALSDEIGQSFEQNWEAVKSGNLGDAIAGAAGILANAGKAVFTNPEAVAQHILTNAPQIAVGAFGGPAGMGVMSAANVGQAVDVFQKGMEAYATKNGGALPSQDRINEMARDAFLIGAAEHAGDLFTLGAGKVLGRGAKQLADAAEDGLTKAASRQTFLEAIKNTGKGVGMGALGEAPVEGAQTYLEGQIMDEPASAKDIFTQAVIGAASGGGIAGALRAPHELSKVGEAKDEDNRPIVEADIKEQRNRAAVNAGNLNAVVKAAEESGDVSGLTDPEKPSYAPDRAIGALFTRTRNQPEEGEKNLESANEILSNLDAEIGGIENALKSPEEFQADLDKVNRQIQKATEMGANQGILDSLAERAKLIQKDIDNPITKEKRTALQARLEKLNALLESGEAAYANLEQLVNPSEQATEQVSESIQTIQQPTEDQDTDAAVSNIVRMAMSNPKSVSGKDLDALVNDESNALTPAQRQALRAFSEARVNANNLRDSGDVAQEIFTGSGENAGILTYFARLNRAFSRNNKQDMEAQLSGISKFAESHEGKLSALNEALAAGPGSQVQRTKDGSWIMVSDPDKKLNKKALDTNGGLQYPTNGQSDVHNENQFNKLIRSITKERDALVAARNQIKAAIDLHSTGTKNKDVKNVQKRENRKKTVDPIPEVQADQTASQQGSETRATESAERPRSGNSDREQQPRRADERSAGSAGTNRSDALDSKAGKAEEGDGIAISPSSRTDTSTPESTTETTDQSDRASGSSTRSIQSPGSEVREDNTLVKSEESTQTKEAIPEPTEASKDSGVPAPQEATDVAPTAQSEPSQPTVPGLLALKEGKEFNKQFQGKKLGEIYTKINRAAAWLTQKRTPVERDQDIPRVRPLTEIDDLLTKLLNKEVSFDDFFIDEDGSGEKFTDDEKYALKRFLNQSKVWSGELRKNFIKGSLPNSKGNRLKADQAYRDPIQDFVNNQNQVDENLVTAIVYAAYSWYTESASNGVLDSEQILEMLGESSDGYLDGAGWKALHQMTAATNTAYDSIGMRVIKVLGLEVSKDAPDNYLPNLRTALGIHAMKLLHDTGLVEVTEIPETDLKEWVPYLKTSNSGKADRSFVKIHRDERFNLSNDVGRAIVDSQKGARNILDRFFGSERPEKMVTTKPQKFTQKVTRKTKMEIPPLLTSVLNEAQKVPHTEIKSMTRALEVLGDQAFLIAAGWVDPESGIQAEKLDSVLAQNHNLETQLDRLKELLSTHPKGQKFFVRYTVWDNFRVGMSTTNLNLQTSKLHRFIMQRPDWVSEINLNDDKQVLNYEMGLAQALGIKVDVKDFRQVQRDFVQLISNPNHKIVQAALDLYASSNDPNAQLTEARKAEIGELAASLEGMQSMQALVSLGEYLNAIETGAPSFKTTLLVGVDGKTNGPILTHAALGAGYNSEDLLRRLNQGGIYGEGDTNFNLWYAKSGNQDLYQSLGTKITSLMGEESLGTKAVQIILGKLLKDEKLTSSGRNLAKTPTTAFMFGSSMESSFDGMTQSFIETIADQIEEVAKNPKSKITRKQLIAAINFMAKKELSRDTTIEELMKLTWSPQDRANLEASFMDVMGDAVIGQLMEDPRTGFTWRVGGAMREEFEPYIKRRNAVNKQVQNAWDIYNNIYQTLLDREMDRLMDEGEISFSVNPKTGQRHPRHDMTAAQKAALRKKVKDFLPVVHTAYSQRSGNLSEGVYMGQTSTGAGQEPFHKTQTYFNDPGQDKEAGNSVLVKEVSPGVAGIPYMIHSLDSTVMHMSLDGTQTLGIHDEGANSANNVVETARRLNKVTWDNLLTYSPSREAYNLFVKSIENSLEFLKSGELDPELFLNVLKSNFTLKQLKGIPIAELPAYLLTIRRAEYVEAERIRLDTLGKTYHIDQYTWQDGQYDVTDRDREAALTERDQLLAEGYPLSPELHDKALEIGKVLEAALKTAREKKQADQAAAKAKPVADAQGSAATKPNTKEESRESSENSTRVGTIGSPAVRPSYALNTFLKSKEDLTVGDVLGFLKGKALALTAFERSLVSALESLIDPSVKVDYITPDNLDAKVDPSITGDDFGWTNISEDGKLAGIQILGDQFKNSNIHATLILHELVHTGLTQALRSKEGAAFKAELEVLMEATQQSMKGSPTLMAAFKQAFTNVDEFLAYGLSSKAFQDHLKSVPFKTKNKGMVSLWKEFLNKIMTFLKVGNDTGLEAFLTNAVGLMELGQTMPMTQPLGNQGTTKLAMNAHQTVDAYTTLELFDALTPSQFAQALPEAFNQHLRDVISNIVDKLYGEMGSLQDAARKTEAGNPYAIWLKALETGKAPFASQVVASSLPSSAQEDLVSEQVEATMRAILDDKAVTSTVAYKELIKLYKEAQQKLNAQDFYEGTDWNQATPYEQKLAQEQYDFLFKMEGKDGTADYLSRFAALGLGNQKVMNLLGFNTEKRVKQINNSLWGKLKELYNGLMDYFVEKASHIKSGEVANQRLASLVDTLVDIEAKRRHGLKSGMLQNNLVNSLEDGVKKVSDKVKAKVQDIADSNIIQNSAYSGVRLLGKVTSVVAGQRVDEFMKGFSKGMNTITEGRPGLVKGLFNELMHPEEVYKKALRMTKLNEQGRKEVITHTSKFVLEGFVDKGKNLTKQAKKAISVVLLRSGAHYLLGAYDTKTIAKWLGDSALLEKEIDTLENQLQGRFAGVQMQQAKALAYYKVTGENVSKELMMNAHNIAKMIGSKAQKHVKPEDAQHNQAVLEKLVAMYAIKYSPNQYRQELRQVMATEHARTEGNGIEATLLMMKNLEKESLDKLFQGNPVLMQHGYTPEIYNPYVQVQAAGDVEGRDLERRGFVRVSRLSKDIGDTDGTVKSLYVQRDGGLPPYISGVISMTGMGAKGAKFHDGMLNFRTRHGAGNASMNAAVKQARSLAFGASTRDGKLFNPMNKSTYMAPVLNGHGEVVNWRYLMQDSTKDKHLERDNDFDTLIGALAGSVFDKPASQKQNKEVVEALFDIYKDQYGSSPKNFLQISPTSRDPQIRELWKLIPDVTKDYINEVWGETPLMVHRDAMDILFGYRQITAASIFKRANDERFAGEQMGLSPNVMELNSINTLQKIMVMAVEGALTAYARGKGMSPQQARDYARRAEAFVAKGERMWQEIVAETKDIIVVKSGIVLAGNIWSNFSLLALNGVSVKDMIRNHRIATKAAMAYQVDTEELARLMNQLATGQAQGKETEISREITRLQNEINRNPVKELIDAGLMPTIVEDVSSYEDPYSYKSALTRKVDGWTGKLHPGVKEAARQVYMAHDTGMYKFLNRTTQLSDFVARYTLYQHLITKKDPLSKEEAIAKAADAFVNYDIPMPQALQYSDAMGFTYFTKYFLRIQRVLFQLATERPGRVLATVALNNFMDLGPIVLDSGMATRIGNIPADWGAGKFVTSIDDLATISTGMAVFK